jgi:hypothetical protein
VIPTVQMAIPPRFLPKVEVGEGRLIIETR